MSKGNWRTRKTTKDSLAATDEARMRQGAKLKLKGQRIRDRLGKKTPKDVRGNAYTDDMIFLKIQSIMNAGSSVRFAAGKGPGVSVVGDISEPPKDPSELIHSDDYDQEVSIYVPLWKHTGDKLKTFAWVMAMRDHGPRGRALNLNIGPDVIRMAERAQRARGIGFARFLRDRMTKHLRKALRPFGLEAPEFFIWVEADRAERAHTHGVIVIPEHPSQTRVVRAIRAALKAAGGRWKPGEHENQLRLKNMYNPAGWAAYVTKWMNLSRLRMQNDSTLAASGGVRSRAKAWYEEARKSGRPLR